MRPITLLVALFGFTALITQVNGHTHCAYDWRRDKERIRKYAEVALQEATEEVVKLQNNGGQYEGEIEVLGRFKQELESMLREVDRYDEYTLQGRVALHHMEQLSSEVRFKVQQFENRRLNDQLAKEFQHLAQVAETKRKQHHTNSSGGGGGDGKWVFLKTEVEHFAALLGPSANSTAFTQLANLLKYRLSNDDDDDDDEEAFVYVLALSNMSKLTQNITYFHDSVLNTTIQRAMDHGLNAEARELRLIREEVKEMQAQISIIMSSVQSVAALKELINAPTGFWQLLQEFEAKVAEMNIPTGPTRNSVLQEFGNLKKQVANNTQDRFKFLNREIEFFMANLPDHEVVLPKYEHLAAILGHFIQTKPKNNAKPDNDTVTGKIRDIKQKIDDFHPSVYPTMYQVYMDELKSLRGQAEEAWNQLPVLLQDTIVKTIVVDGFGRILDAMNSEVEQIKDIFLHPTIPTTEFTSKPTTTSHKPNTPTHKPNTPTRKPTTTTRKQTTTTTHKPSFKYTVLAKYRDLTSSINAKLITTKPTGRLLFLQIEVQRFEFQVNDLADTTHHALLGYYGILANYLETRIRPISVGEHYVYRESSGDQSQFNQLLTEVAKKLAEASARVKAAHNATLQAKLHVIQDQIAEMKRQVPELVKLLPQDGQRIIFASNGFPALLQLIQIDMQKIVDAIVRPHRFASEKRR